jgi:hypothetical protein
MAEVTEPPSETSQSGPKVADHAACIAAIEALSDTELRILKGFGRFMACRKGVLYSADGDDLLHEAIARTLGGKRKWIPQQVDFVTHLKGCMRSIAHEYTEKAISESKYRSPELNAREHYWRTKFFDRVRADLRPDEIAVTVFDRLLEGHSPAEIRQMLTLDEKDYNAVRKKISRCMQTTFSKWLPKNEHNLFSREFTSGPYA